MTARPACAHWDIKTASLSLQGGKLTSQYKEQLKTQLQDKAHKEQLKTQLQDKALTTFIKENES
jgi:hypothetical protein